MTAYYNEHDPFAAAWLRELIKAGHITDGVVDERDIQDVTPDELAGFNRCHFFAGIGGWEEALRLARWPEDRPVWTGSAPCQPFSAAGQGKGVDDERHLWPHFHHLIKVCKPDIIFGEQVDAAIRHGWLDLVQDDLEGEGYAFGAVGIPAAGVGAPHIRSRLFWVADSQRTHHRGEIEAADNGRDEEAHRPASRLGGHCGSPILVGDTDSAGPQRRIIGRDGPGKMRSGKTGVGNFWGEADWLWCRDEKYRPVEPGTEPLAYGVPARVGRLRGYGNAIVPQVAAGFIKAFG